MLTEGTESNGVPSDLHTATPDNCVVLLGATLGDDSSFKSRFTGPVSGMLW